MLTQFAQRAIRPRSPRRSSHAIGFGFRGQTFVGAFDEAVKIDPHNVTALVGQGEVLYADGRYTEALTRFEEGVLKERTPR